MTTKLQEAQEALQKAQDYVDSLRVELEKPKFKIGDWVYTPGQDNDFNDKKFLAQVTGKDYCEIELGQKYRSYINSLSTATLWEPTEGEWIVYMIGSAAVPAYSARKYEPHMKDYLELAPLASLLKLKDER